MQHRVVLFTKPAVPGLVKTRLQTEDGSGAPAISASQAANLHLAFLKDTASVLSKVCDGIEGAVLSIAWALDSGHPPEPCLSHLHGFEQVGSGLGDRLLHGINRWQDRSVCERSPEVVVVVGSDHPELDGAVVAEAIEVVASGQADLAVGPADDGGYYLIAVRGSSVDSRLFEGIDWSTPSVFEQTISRAEEAGLQWHRLSLGFDCDTPRDLAALNDRLAVGDAEATGHCPATRAWLAGSGLFDAQPVKASIPASATFEQLRAAAQREGGFLSMSEAETVAFGRSFGRFVVCEPDASSDRAAVQVLLLEGDMGAGKTALVRGVAEGLGLLPAHVQSPTFTLINEYADEQGIVRLVHCDLYRLESEDLEAAGILDTLNREDCLIVVEWSERLHSSVPGAVTLRLSRVAGQSDADQINHQRRIVWL